MSPQRNAISEYLYETIQTLSSLQKQYLPRALASEEMNGPGQKYLGALKTPKVLLSPNPGIHDEQREVGAHLRLIAWPVSNQRQSENCTVCVRNCEALGFYRVISPCLNCEALGLYKVISVF